jgi:hypothetical protein
MKMRVVPTKVHGALDYVTGPALTVAPELLRLKDGRSASLPPRLVGLGTAASAALTDHELARKRVVPMKAHLALDAASGVALALAPWIGGSAKKGTRNWLPHAIVGAKEVALALTTKTQPADKRRLPGIPRKALVAAGVGATIAAAALVALKRAGGPPAQPGNVERPELQNA